MDKKKEFLRRASREDLEQVQETEKARLQEEQILKLNIKWETRHEAKEITGEEKGLIIDYCRQSDISSRMDLLSEPVKGAQYGRLFVSLLNKIHEKETSQYVLTLVDQLLQENPENAVYFQVAGGYDEFLRILNISDAYSVDKAARILSILLSTRLEGRPPAAEKFLRWILARLNESKTKSIIQILMVTKDFLKNTNNQTLFASENGLSRLMQVLDRDGTNSQVQYLVGFCCWLMAFNPECYAAIHSSAVIRRLVAIVKISSREKVVRICFATFRALLDQKPSDEHSFNDEMIALGVLKIIPSLMSKTGWKDEDIPKILKVINDNLGVAFDKLSSFEMYHAELESGSLQWSPVHSELFWRENVNKFEAKNFALIQRVVKLLDDTKDETVLEVACFDLGEFARVHPDGKRVIEACKAKPKIMALLNHSNPEVRKQALLCTQKLMVQNWETLSKTNKKEGAGGKGS